MEGLPYQYIRWIENEEVDPKKLDLSSDTKVVQDFRFDDLALLRHQLLGLGQLDLFAPLHMQDLHAFVEREVEKEKLELDDPRLAELIGPALHETLVDDIELLDGASYEFDMWPTHPK